MIPFMHDQEEPIYAVALLFALLLIMARAFAMDIPISSAIVGFFLQPWALVAFTLVLLAPNFFFRWFPGSIATFVAGLILFLALRAGVH